MSEDIRARLGIEPNTGKAVKAIRELQKDIKETSVDVRSIARSAQEAEDGLVKRLRKPKTAIKDIRKEINGLRNDIIDAGSGFETIEEKLKRIQKQSSKVRYQVGGLGDIETASRAIGGAGEALTGIGGFGAGSIVVGEIFAVSEALPQLKVALNELPILAKTASQSLGKSGIGLGASLAILTVALLAAGRASRKSAEDVNEAKNAEEEYFEFIANATEEDVQNRIRQLEEQRNSQKLALDETNRDLAQGRKAVGEFATNLLDAADAIGAGALDITGNIGAYEALSDRQKEQADNLSQTEAKLKLYNSALEDQTIIANSAAAAILQQAQAAGEAVRVSNEATQRTAEQNQDRLQQIERDREVIQAQIDALEQSGNASEEVTARLEQLRQQLAALGQESNIVSDVLASGRSKTEEIDNEIIEKTRQFEDQRAGIIRSSGERITSIQRNASNAIEDIARRTADQREKIELDFARATADAVKEANQERADIIRESQDEEAKDYREHQRTLRDIQKDSEEERRDAAIDNDFRRLFELENSLANEIDAENQALQDTAEDRRIARNDAFRDLRIDIERERNERIKDRQRALEDLKEQQRIQERDARIANSRQLEEARRASEAQLEELKRRHEMELKLIREQTDAITKAIKGASDDGKRRGDIRTRQIGSGRRRNNYAITQAARVI